MQLWSLLGFLCSGRRLDYARASFRAFDLFIHAVFFKSCSFFFCLSCPRIVSNGLFSSDFVLRNLLLLDLWLFSLSSFKNLQLTCYTKFFVFYKMIPSYSIDSWRKKEYWCLKFLKIISIVIKYKQFINVQKLIIIVYYSIILY